MRNVYARTHVHKIEDPGFSIFLSLRGIPSSEDFQVSTTSDFHAMRRYISILNNFFFFHLSIWDRCRNRARRHGVNTPIHYTIFRLKKTANISMYDCATNPPKIGKYKKEKTDFQGNSS